jgi:rod shape-determining protein MreD
MRRAAALLVLGIGCLVLQGAAATVAPPPYCPDLALLVVLGMGLRWEGLPSGFGLAAALGYATDVLSGSLLGQHVLLRLFAFAGAHLGSRQLNLRGPLPLALFAAGVTVAYGIGLLALTRFFATPAAASWSWGIDLIQHALVNAIFAPWVSSAVERVSAWTGEDEAGRRPLRLDPRRTAL